MKISTKFITRSLAIIVFSGNLRGGDEWTSLSRVSTSLVNRGVKRVILDLRNMDGIDFAGLCLLRQLVTVWSVGGAAIAATRPSPRLTSPVAIFKLPEVVGELHEDPDSILEMWISGQYAA
jgi:anti-anti-sigma regulatory factor